MVYCIRDARVVTFSRPEAGGGALGLSVGFEDEASGIETALSIFRSPGGCVG